MGNEELTERTGQWPTSTVQADTVYPRRSCQQEPHEDCVWKRPWPATFSQLTPACQDQNIKCFDPPPRTDQECELAKDGPRQPNRRISSCSKPMTQPKSVPASRLRSNFVA